MSPQRTLQSQKKSAQPMSGLSRLQICMDQGVQITLKFASPIAMFGKVVFT
jgi:hypothetical protein